MPPGTGTVVAYEGRAVALFNVDGAFHAIDNTCLHRGGPLGQGTLSGRVVACPLHRWEYDVTTGRCVDQPQLAVTTYAVRVVDGDVQVSA